MVVWVADSYSNIWLGLFIIAVAISIAIGFKIWEEKERTKITTTHENEINELKQTHEIEKKKWEHDRVVEKMELLLKKIYYYLSNNLVNIVIHQKIDEEKYNFFTRKIGFHGQSPEVDIRTKLIKEGIVRLAFERVGGGTVFHTSFKDNAEKEDKLKNLYNYRENDVNTMLEDGQMSFYCRTIVHRDVTWGVLFMSSLEKSAFCDENGQLNKELDKEVGEIIALIQEAIL